MDGIPNDQQQSSKEAEKSKEQREVLLSHIQSQSNPLSTLEKHHPTTDRVQAAQAGPLPVPDGTGATPGLKGVIQAPLVPEVRMITTSSRQHVGYARPNLTNTQFGVNSHSQLSTASNNILNIVQQSSPGLLNSQPEIFQEAGEAGFANSDEANTHLEFMRQNEEMVKIIQMCPFKNSRELLQNKQKRQLYDQIIGTPKKFNNKLIQIKNSIFQQRAEMLQKKYEHIDVDHLNKTQQLVNVQGAEGAASLELASSLSGRKGHKKSANKNLGGFDFWSSTKQQQRAASAVGQTAVQRRIQPYLLDDQKMRSSQGYAGEAGRNASNRRRTQIVKANDLMKAKMKKRAIIGHKIASSSQSRNGEILKGIKEMETHQFEASSLSNRQNKQTVNNELTLANMLDSNENTISQIVGTDRLSDQREVLSINESHDVGQSHQIKVIDQNLTSSCASQEKCLVDISNSVLPVGKSAEWSKHQQTPYHQTGDTEPDITPPPSKLAANYLDPAGKQLGERYKSKTRAQSKTMNRRKGASRWTEAVSQEKTPGPEQSSTQVLDPNWRFQQFNASSIYQSPSELQSDILVSQGYGPPKRKTQKRRNKYTTAQYSKSKNILMFHNVEEMKQSQATHAQKKARNLRSGMQVASWSRDETERPIQTRVVHQSGGGAIFTSKTQVSKLNKISSQPEAPKRYTSSDKETRRRVRLLPKNEETMRSMNLTNPNIVPRPNLNATEQTKNATAMSKANPLNNLLIQSVKPELISKYNAQVKQWTQAPTVSVGENLRIEPGGANMTMLEKQLSPQMLTNQKTNSKSMNENRRINSQNPNMNFSFETTQFLINQGGHQQYLKMDPQKQATFQRFIQRFSNSLINEKKVKDERTRQINLMLESQIGAVPLQNIKSSNNLPASQSNSAQVPGGWRSRVHPHTSSSTAWQRQAPSPVTLIHLHGQPRPFSQEILPPYQPTQQSYASQKSYVNDPSTQCDASPFNIHRIPVGQAHHQEVPQYHFNIHHLDPQLQDTRSLRLDESRPETILRQIEQYDYEKKRHESLAHIQQSINEQQLTQIQRQAKQSSRAALLLTKQRELSQQNAIQKSDEELIQKNLLQLQSSVNENKTISLVDGNAGFGDLVNEQRKLSKAEATFIRSTNSALYAAANDSFEASQPNTSHLGREILTIQNAVNGAVSNSSELRASYDAEPNQVQRKSRQQILINTPSNYLLQQAQSQHKEAQKPPPSPLKDRSQINMVEDQSPRSIKQLGHTQRSNHQSQSPKLKESTKFVHQSLRRSALMKKQPQLNKDLEVVSNESTKKAAAGSPKVMNQRTREPDAQVHSMTGSVIQPVSKPKGDHQDYLGIINDRASISDNNLSLSADLNTTWRRKEVMEVTRTTVKNGGNHQSLEVRPGRLPNDSLVSSDRASSRSRNSKIPKQHSKASSFLTFDRLNNTHVYQPSIKCQNVNVSQTNESMIQESLVPMPIIIKTAAINEFGEAHESATYDDNLQQIIDEHKKRIGHVNLVDQQFGLIQIAQGAGICSPENHMGASSFNMNQGGFGEQAENVIMMHNHNQNLIYIQKLQELQMEHLKERLKAQEKKSMKVKTFDCPLPELPDEQDLPNNPDPSNQKGISSEAPNTDLIFTQPMKSEIQRKSANSRCRPNIYNKQSSQYSHAQVPTQRILGEHIGQPNTMSSHNLRQKLFSSRSRKQQIPESSSNQIYQKGMQRPLSVTSRHAFPQQQVLTSLGSAGKKKLPHKKQQTYLHLIQSKDYVVVKDAEEEQTMVQQVAFDRYGNLKPDSAGAMAGQANVRGLNLKIQPRRQNNNFNEYTGLQKSLDEVEFKGGIEDLVDTQRALQQDIMISNHEMSLRNQNMQLCDTIPIQINSLHGSHSAEPSPGRGSASLSPQSSKRQKYVAIDLSMPEADLCGLNSYQQELNNSQRIQHTAGASSREQNVTID